MPSLTPDYLERVYAGVLGKLVGVYLGRPFEGWDYPRIVNELGPIRFYVHERFDLPLVVADDGISGTFVFVRALEEHGGSPELTAGDIGKTCLNNIVVNRTVFWSGGRGTSSARTTYHHVKHGISAPLRDGTKANGPTIAEQIGAQAFIDAWALVAPGNPALAVKFAETAC